MKNITMTVRLSPEDKRRLEVLATLARRKPTDMVRVLINDEYENKVDDA